MDHDCPGDDARSAAQEILGYLNFSSGTPDPRFLANVNMLFERLEHGRKERPGEEPSWEALGSTLRAELEGRTPENLSRLLPPASVELDTISVNLPNRSR